MVNNPYIEKVKNHDKILTGTEIIYSNKGKWSKFFDNENPIVLEIGTGLGNFFSSEVLDNPDKNFIGIELRYKRLYKTAEKSLGNTKNNDNSQNGNQPSPLTPLPKGEGKEKGNNFVVLKDFGENAPKIFGEEELDLIYIFFPDPWDKNEKTIKNRLVQTELLNNLYNITKQGGKLIFKTDHSGYFEDVLKDIEKTSWKINFQTFDYEKENLYNKNKITEFEQIFRGQNIKVCYIELEK